VAAKAEKFGAFLRNFTGASPDRLEDWTEAFLVNQSNPESPVNPGKEDLAQPEETGASEVPWVEHRFRFPEDLELAWSGHAWPDKPTHVAMELVSRTVGDWALVQEVPFKAWTFPKANFSLLVNAVDWVQFHGDFGPGPNRTDYVQHVQDRVQGVGLPRPPEELEFDQTHC
jgi:hypothetical protein